MTDVHNAVGNSRTQWDNLDENHLRNVAAAVDRPVLAVGDALPLLWHWTLFNEAPRYQDLMADGHATVGDFLPASSLKSRMWAGGEVEFLAPLRAGMPAKCVSRVASVTPKQGRMGALLFVAVNHEVFQNDGLCVRERQDIVYRHPAPPRFPAMAQALASDWSTSITPSEIMLFRYSAVTYNSHRIHYDQRYAHEVEHYPGLVVHGPLTMTLLLGAFVQRYPEFPVRRFGYRSLAPIIAPQPFTVAGTAPDRQGAEPNGRCELWAIQNGVQTTTAWVQR